jgi:hypothetical protein
MIQRIQTLHFLIAILLICLSLFGLAFFSFQLKESSLNLNPFGLVSDNDSSPYYFWIVQVGISLILLLTVFSYKNRKRQILLGWTAFSLHLFLMSWILFTVFFTSPLKDCNDYSMELGFYSYASAFLFIFLGIKGVRKDKALIDSLNRLR